MNFFRIRLHELGRNNELTIFHVARAAGENGLEVARRARQDFLLLGTLLDQTGGKMAFPCEMAARWNGYECAGR